MVGDGIPVRRGKTDPNIEEYHLDVLSGIDKDVFEKKSYDEHPDELIREYQKRLEDGDYWIICSGC